MRDAKARELKVTSIANVQLSGFEVAAGGNKVLFYPDDTDLRFSTPAVWVQKINAAVRRCRPPRPSARACARLTLRRAGRAVCSTPFRPRPTGALGELASASLGVECPADEAPCARTHA